METEKSYTCTNCKKRIDVPITVVSHDEYWVDGEECPCCGYKIPIEDQCELLNNAAEDFVSSRIDWAHDAYKDRMMDEANS